MAAAAQAAAQATAAAATNGVDASSVATGLVLGLRFWGLPESERTRAASCSFGQGSQQERRHCLSAHERCADLALGLTSCSFRQEGPSTDLPGYTAWWLSTFSKGYRDCECCRCRPCWPLGCGSETPCLWAHYKDTRSSSLLKLLASLMCNNDFWRLGSSSTVDFSRDYEAMNEV